MQETQTADPGQQEATPVAGIPVPGEALPNQQQEQSSPPAQANPELERRARDMGWVPQTEWRGSPEAWRPADEFVRRGEEVLPIVRAREREAQGKVRDLEAKIASLEQNFGERARRLEGMSLVALEKQRERMWQDFEVEKRRAVSDGDTDRYDKLSNAQHQAMANFKPEEEAERLAPPAPAKQQQAAVPQEVNDWVDQNRWFRDDPKLSEQAAAFFGFVQKDEPYLTLSEHLAKTAQYIKEKNPDRFGMSPRQPAAQQQPHAPAVEGGGRQPQGTNRVRGWETLPPEAKQSAEKFITRDGLFLPKGADRATPTDAELKAARAAYAKSYWEQEA